MRQAVWMSALLIGCLLADSYMLNRRVKRLEQDSKELTALSARVQQLELKAMTQPASTTSEMLGVVIESTPVPADGPGWRTGYIWFQPPDGLGPCCISGDCGYPSRRCKFSASGSGEAKHGR